MSARRWSTTVMLAVLVVLPVLPASGVTSAEPVTIWQSGSVDEATEGAAELAAAIVGARVVTVLGGSLRMMGVTRAGVDVQRPPSGFGYPMSVRAIASADAALIDESLPSVLGRGDVVMSERSAALRDARVGDTITMEGWNGIEYEMTIGDIVADEHLGFTEIVMSAGWADRLAFDRISSIVIVDAPAEEVVAAFDSVAPDAPIQIGTPDQPIEFDDPVLATVAVKERFGEFAFRPTGVGDAIQIEDAWLEANIVTVELPHLGLFRCNRAIVPHLRTAIDRLIRMGAIDAIDPVDFQIAGGCFNSRMARGGDKGFALSRHAWGVAIDINPSTNRYGEAVTMDPRIADVMASLGFSWGANWTVPDGMHFEWARLPTETDDCAPVRLIPSQVEGDPWTVIPSPGC